MIIKCKSCGSNIRYDIALRRLFCDYCGNSFIPEEYEDESETFDAVTYTCQNCGAELITTEDTEATAFCSFCGSAAILTGRLEQIKKPDGILPFKITKEQCKEIYLKKANETFLAPKWMKEPGCVESFRAIYMPYWSYTLHVKGNVAHQTYYDYGERRDGDYIVEYEKEYKDKHLDEDIAGWSHDASNKFADDISETIGFTEIKEKEIKPFRTAYLRGFYADMAEEASAKHKEMATRGMLARLNNAWNDMICSFDGSVDVTTHKLNYMPVWFMSVRNGEDLCYAAVNGYNGKIVADFPISKRGFYTIAGIAAAILAAFLSLVLVLRPEPAYWVSLALAAIGLIICSGEQSRLRETVEITGIKAPGEGTTAISILLMVGTMLLLTTKNNLIIYGAVLLLAAIFSFNCLSAFRIHQLIARRRPPQLNRKGAEKDA